MGHPSPLIIADFSKILLMTFYIKEKLTTTTTTTSNNKGSFGLDKQNLQQQTSCGS